MVFLVPLPLATDMSIIIGWDVTSTKTIDLATDGISDLNSFMAAAGYTDSSAILDTIGDPPFVQKGWATAEVAVRLSLLSCYSLKPTYI